MRFHVIGYKAYPCIFSYLVFHSYKILSFTYTSIFSFWDITNLINTKLVTNTNRHLVFSNNSNEAEVQTQYS